MEAPMAAAFPHRTITDDLLTVSIGIKQEAGVGHAPIQAVIHRFASEERWNERTGGIGFPLVEDIPQSCRAEFMVALAELVADRPINSRMVSAAQIWPARVI
jgi:hypothetical protein